ncbi:hypothetical protein CN326_22070 [Bacillus sp. AFS018417]|uniref:hypothetical protein n=1 Tax=Bacillus sp. AFS018417 TaxID=2033491 RepID=UPI000BF3AD06|nr:hypothetical protein [Bacillus sp. AFS018417]PEZ00979.1 hypothetical protein CN326_22070 [Bacillus sp. AFS018417]
MDSISEKKKFYLTLPLEFFIRKLTLEFQFEVQPIAIKLKFFSTPEQKFYALLTTDNDALC